MSESTLTIETEETSENLLRSAREDVSELIFRLK
jgi:hypothetical protein